MHHQAKQMEVFWHHLWLLQVESPANGKVWSEVSGNGSPGFPRKPCCVEGSYDPLPLGRLPRNHRVLVTGARWADFPTSFGSCISGQRYLSVICGLAACCSGMSPGRATWWEPQVLSPGWGCREVLSQPLTTVDLRCGYGDLAASLAQSGEMPSHAWTWADLVRRLTHWATTSSSSITVHWTPMVRRRCREASPLGAMTLRGGAVMLGSNCRKDAGLG